MTFFKLAFISLLIALLAGCCYCKKHERLYGRPLEETRWTLVQVDGRVPETTYVLVFAKNGQMTIEGGGTLIKTTYKVYDNGTINMENFGMEHGTAVDEELENHIYEQLKATTTYKMDGKFVMMIRNAEMWALFEAKEPRGYKRYKPEVPDNDVY